jgi:hypothetical protein
MEQDHKFMKERLQFKQLMMVNPNYFGTNPDLKFKAQINLSGHTSYEEITCVGFNPDFDELEATIAIKRQSGYQGDLCHAGSQEFVRFYIDYGNGAGWEDVGLSAFNAHDIPDSKDCAKHQTKPLTYTVSQPLKPNRNYCGKPVLPLVRAILSWQSAPPANQPNWTQVWGNTKDVNIQIKPRRRQLFDIFDSLQLTTKIPLELHPIMYEPLNLPEPPLPELKTLAALYSPKSKAEVAPHRFAMNHVNMVNSSTGFSETALINSMEVFKSAGIDWNEVLGKLEKTKGDVSFEELNCLGLDYNREWLIASLQIKKSSGFSGGPCTAGSVEHVAFWVDWDDTCQWTYLGTSTVKVHDYPSIPENGLHYWVGMPAKLAEHKRTCAEPKIGRVRAVLSWNTPPSTTDPDAIPHWGNRVDSHVEIKPANGEIGLINIIGGVKIDSIDVAGNGMTKNTIMPPIIPSDPPVVVGAKFALTGDAVDTEKRPCPFGGRVVIQGYVPDSFVASGRKYRLVAKKFGTDGNNKANLFPVRTEFNITGSIFQVKPDADGFVSYINPNQNVSNNLGFWETGSLGNEKWEIRLEMYDITGVLIGQTPWYTIQLNHTPPEANMEIENGGDCKDFVVGDVIKGKFLARHEHFGSWNLITKPTSLAPPNPLPVSPTPHTTQTGLAPGDEWKLNTTGMKPCGYVIELSVVDRTILNSTPHVHNTNYDDTGFSLRTTKCDCDHPE